MYSREILLVACYLFWTCSSSPKNNYGGEQNSISHENYADTPTIDSKTLDSLLYREKFRLEELKKGKFSYATSYNRKRHTASIASRTKVGKNRVEYNIYFETPLNNFDLDNADFFNDTSFTYLSSEIRIDKRKTDLTNLTFVNDSSSKVFPAGPWHWSVEESGLKYYSYKGKEYYLINGANLYCNGTHCNSFQIYLVIIDNVSIKAFAFFLDGVLPYTFDEVHLIDSDADGNPEIYIPKRDIRKIEGISDFQLYEVDNSQSSGLRPIALAR